MSKFKFRRLIKVLGWEQLEGTVEAENLEHAIILAKDDEEYNDNVESTYIYETFEPVNPDDIAFDYIEKCEEVEDE